MKNQRKRERTERERETTHTLACLHCRERRGGVKESGEKKGKSMIETHIERDIYLEVYTYFHTHFQTIYFSGDRREKK